MLPETILTHDGAQGFLAAPKPPPPIPQPSPADPFPAPPWPGPRTRCCQWCGGEPAVIFDIDGCWDTEECQRYDRSSETTWWRRWER